MRIIVFIASSINWLFVGIADVDLVATLFGGDSALSTIIYILVGLSALWQLVPFIRAFSTGETAAEANASRFD